eukprot:scaffold100718_cov36-Phaeocystis_antarctica.AAC.1
MPRSAGAWRAVCSSALQSVVNSGGPPCAAGSRGGPHACASGAAAALSSTVSSASSEEQRSSTLTKRSRPISSVGTSASAYSRTTITGPSSPDSGATHMYGGPGACVSAQVRTEESRCCGRRLVERAQLGGGGMAPQPTCGGAPTPHVLLGHAVARDVVGRRLALHAAQALWTCRARCPGGSFAEVGWVGVCGVARA